MLEFMQALSLWSWTVTDHQPNRITNVRINADTIVANKLSLQINISKLAYVM